MQGRLFGADAYGNPVPLSRSSDPQTSHDAAAAHVASGKLGRHAEIVLGLAQRHPGSTYKELFHYATENEKLTLREAVEVMRRLSGLAHDGRVRRGPVRHCTVAGGKMTTWEAI